MARQKHFCKYCKKLVAQLPRHITSVHKDKESLSFLSPKRKMTKLRTLRKEGAALHNLSLDGDENIICSRPLKSRLKTDYKTCPDCKYSYLETSFRKHVVRCLGNNKSKVQSSSFPIDDELLTQKVLAIMRRDAIYEVVVKDELILKFGSRLLSKNRKEPHIYNHVSNKMRELGKLVLEMNSKNSQMKSLKQAISPQHFLLLVSSVKIIAGFDKMTNLFKVPTLPIKMGHAIKKCASILQIEAIYLEDLTYYQQISSFIDLCEKDWNHQVGVIHAKRTLEEGKWNNPRKLPESSDINTLIEYLNRNELKLLNQLEECGDDIKKVQKYWKELASIVLVHIIVFNRRRSGEISRLELKSFLDSSGKSRMDQEANEHMLNDIELKLASLFNRIEIRGKKGRGVAVLLSPQLMHCCDILVKYRPFLSISKSNPYFFANKDKYLRGTDCLRNISKALELENLTSTNLRKHVATMVQIMSLSNSEMESFAECMGHNLDVHKQFYRLSNDITHKAKFAKLFMCLAHGKKYLHHFKKKTFDEIEITDEMLEDIIGSEESHSRSTNGNGADDTDKNVPHLRDYGSTYEEERNEDDDDDDGDDDDGDDDYDDDDDEKNRVLRQKTNPFDTRNKAVAGPRTMRKIEYHKKKHDDEVKDKRERRVTKKKGFTFKTNQFHGHETAHNTDANVMYTPSSSRNSTSLSAAKCIQVKKVLFKPIDTEILDDEERNEDDENNKVPQQITNPFNTRNEAVVGPRPMRKTNYDSLRDKVESRVTRKKVLNFKINQFSDDETDETPDDTDEDATYTPTSSTNPTSLSAGILIQAKRVFSNSPASPLEAHKKRKLDQNERKKWVKWSNFEIKILQVEFRDNLILGTLPGIHDIRQRVGQKLTNRSTEEIRQKIRRLIQSFGKQIR